MPNPNEDWVSEEAIQNLAMERELHPSESPEETAERIFREAVPIAAAGIVHCALYSSTERTRFDAQKYVVERVMGKPGESLKVEGKNVWDDLLAAAVKFGPPQFAEEQESEGRAVG